MKNTLLLSIALIALFAASCKKNDNNNTPAPVYGTYSSIDTIFTMLAVPSKFVNIDAAAGGTFYGNSGTQYIFSPGCFIDGTGASVTGTVQMEVKELLLKGDMIFSKVLPVSGGDPLFSGGEVYAAATQSGQQLYLKPGYNFQANIPQGKTPLAGMSFFAGHIVSDPANIVLWKPDADSVATGSVVYLGDTISIISDSLHWCNADQFITSPHYQTFTVTLSITGSPTVAPSSMLTYTLYDTYKGVWPMGSPANNIVSENHVPNIPVHFVSFGLINGKFYGGVTAATPAANGNYVITLTQVDPTAFKGQLNNLTN